MSYGQALAVGLGQTLSLLPGMSRSASTIVAGLLTGMDRRVATDFSFMLALPTLYAASFYALFNARDRLDGDLGFAMMVGLVTAFVSAWIVIHAFLRFVQTNTLQVFGWYRMLIGAAVLWLAR